MSQDLEGSFERGGHGHRPWLGINQPLFREHDGSEPLLSMYLKIGEEEDRMMVERWQKDAEENFLFTGLFSAVVATLLSVTVLDLKPNSQDTSTFYLRNLYLIQSDPNISLASIPSEPPPFSAPISAIWVNALLFLSLLISLTCALLATLLQQSARRYVGFTQQPELSLQRRARVRAFFSEGVDKSHISWVAEALPALVHISIYLFISGLLVWLFNINHLVFLAVVFFSALFVVAYLWFTFLPIFWLNNPCYTPISPIIWFTYTGISYTVFNVLSSSVFGASRRFDVWKHDYSNQLSEGIGKTAERTARKLSSEIDVRILVSTLDAQRDDSARAKYFEAIQSFFDSNQADLHSQSLEDFRIKFRPVLNGFLERTFSSGLISEPARSAQLLITCLNTAYKAFGTGGTSQILFHILNGGSQWGELLQSVEMAHSLRRWSKNTDDEITHYVRRIVTQVVASVRERDGRWISLTKDEFGVPDSVLRDNITYGDSALLSLLIHLTRQAFRTGSRTPFILNTLTRFDMGNTLPELQHDFCSLRNEIVREAGWGGENCTAVNILREIRSAYIGLHQGTDAAPTAFSVHTNFFNPVLAQPRSYPFCDMLSHRPYSIIPTPQDPLSNHLTIPALTRAAFGSSAASTTQLGDPLHPSPPSNSLEIQDLPPSHDILIISPNTNVVHTVAQRAEEANIIPRFSSSPDLTMMRSDHVPLFTQASLPSTPCPLFITLPAADSSIPIGLSPRSSHPARSAGDTDANCAHTDDLTPRADSHRSGTGENSQVSIAASSPSPHPDLHLTIIDSLAGLVPSPFSVPDPDRDFDASRCPTLAATLSRPPKSKQVQDTAAPWAESDISEISTTANLMPPYILSGGSTLPKSEELKGPLVPSAIFSDSQSSPIPTPANCCGEIPVGFPSHADPVGTLSDHISHTLGSPSESSTRICSYTFPWPSSVLYSPLMPSDVLRAHGDTSEIERPIPMVVLSDASQSSTLTLDIGARTLQPDDTSHA